MVREWEGGVALNRETERERERADSLVEEPAKD